MGENKSRKPKRKRPGTIRRIPDDLSMEVQPLLPREKALGSNGRPVVPFRKVLDPPVTEGSRNGLGKACSRGYG
jgi:hypothetical protein